MIPGSCNGAQDADILLPTTLLCPRFDPLSCVPILAVHSALISINILYTNQCSVSGMRGDVPVTIIPWPAVVACAQAKATDPAGQRRLRAGHRSWRPEWSRRELQRCLCRARPSLGQRDRLGVQQQLAAFVGDDRRKRIFDILTIDICVAPEASEEIGRAHV